MDVEQSSYLPTQLPLSYLGYHHLIAAATPRFYDSLVSRNATSLAVYERTDTVKAFVLSLAEY